MTGKNKKIEGGLFFSFEGIEGSGKSTQSGILAEKLRGEGYNVLETREPGGTRVGNELRNIVQHICGDEAVCTEAELLIFCASRAQLIRKVIMPHLLSGGIVICDRFADSTTAYQGYGRGIDMNLIANLHQFTLPDRWPDLTFLLDLDVTIGLRRSKTRPETLGVQDRIEDESPHFHEKVRQGFLAIARQETDRIIVINAEEGQQLIKQKIEEPVCYALERLS